MRLAEPETVEQYAHDLYAALRAADKAGIRRVVALAPGGPGIAAAIRDRLQRASHRASDPDAAH
jgi:L-threonylcarbamoyladenylate synthase